MTKLQKARPLRESLQIPTPKTSRNQKITEPEETEESDTNKSNNIINQIKDIVDPKCHITMTIATDGLEKEFIVDSGSPVKILPPDTEIMKNPKFSPITQKNQDVNENEVKFAREITVAAESRGIRSNLTFLFTKREDIKPLLGMDWLRKIKSEMDKIIGRSEQLNIPRLKHN